MTRMTIAVAVSALLLAGSASAQTVPPPAQTPPPVSALPMPTPTPAAVPFPEGAKVAYVDLQQVVTQSLLGKQGQEAMKVLNDKLGSDLAAKNKEIIALQDKMKTQQNVVSEPVFATMGRELEKLQRDAQFKQQDANAQIEALNQDLLKNFQAQVLPVVEKLRDEKGLWIIFALGDQSNIAAAHAGLDLSTEVIKRLDASFKK